MRSKFSIPDADRADKIPCSRDVGRLVGENVGASVGRGCIDGACVGEEVGALVGGPALGTIQRTFEGDTVGARVDEGTA